MAIKSGLAAQFGMVNESTYGTAVTVTRFLDFNSESIKTQLYHPKSSGLGAGRFGRTTHVGTPVVIGAAGDVEFDVANKGFGLLLKHMLGANTPAQVGVTTEYTHTCIPDAAGMQGIAASVQIGKPGTDGTVRPFSYEGGKVSSWEINQANDAILKIRTSWDFETLATGAALASASYATAREFFNSSQLALTVGGTTVFTNSLTISGDNGLGLDRRGLTQSVKKEPLAVGPMVITGTLDAEFEDLTHYNSLIAGTQQALVATWTGSTIPAEANPFKIVLTIPAIKFTGDPPAVDGPGIVRMQLPFEALYNGSDALITIVYHTTDSAA